MRIGEVAREAGVNLQTLRYYERRGLLQAPRRTSSGYRDYAPEAVRVVRFIKRAQELGFTLAEAGELLRLRDGRLDNREQVQELTTAKLRHVEKRIHSLEAVREALSRLLRSCRCGESPECPILEALAPVRLQS